MKRGTCATCTFFQDVHQECRFNPPTLVVIQPRIDGGMYHVTDARFDSRWPNVDSDDWCAHYQSAIVGGVRKTYNHQINDGDVQFLDSTTEETGE